MPLMRRLPQHPITGQDQSQPTAGDALSMGPLGMVGGLPEGLNPGAIEMMLKTMGLDVPGAAGMAKAAQTTFPNAAKFMDFAEPAGSYAPEGSQIMRKILQLIHSGSNSVK